MPLTNEDRLMTLPEAADSLGRHRSTLRDAVDRGTLPTVGRIGGTRRGGIIVVREDDVRSYAQRNGIDMK